MLWSVARGCASLLAIYLLAAQGNVVSEEDRYKILFILMSHKKNVISIYPCHISKTWPNVLMRLI